MSQTIQMDQALLAFLVMGVFAFIGYRRGVIRELIATAAIVLAPFVGPWAGRVLQPWANRFYRLALFARFGGLATDDTSAVMERVRQVPPLISTPEDVVLLGVVIFVIIILLGYVIGQWRVKAPSERPPKLLGAVIGAVNGFLLVEIVLPHFWKAQYAVLVVPTAGTLQWLSGRTGIILVVAFVAIVLYGLSLAAKK